MSITKYCSLQIYIYTGCQRDELFQPGSPRAVSLGDSCRSRQPVGEERRPTTEAEGIRASVAYSRVREHTTLAYEFWSHGPEQLPSLFQIMV